MEKFVMKKSTEANIYKSIRFPVEINSQIIDIVENCAGMFFNILWSRSTANWDNCDE